MARTRVKTTVTDEELRLLRTRDVAKLIGVTPETLRTWRYQRRGPRYIKIGRDARYRPADILDWQRKCKLVEPKRL